MSLVSVYGRPLHFCFHDKVLFGSDRFQRIFLLIIGMAEMKERMRIKLEKEKERKKERKKKKTLRKSSCNNEKNNTTDRK